MKSPPVTVLCPQLWLARAAQMAIASPDQVPPLPTAEQMDKSRPSGLPSDEELVYGKMVPVRTDRDAMLVRFTPILVVHGVEVAGQPVVASNRKPLAGGLHSVWRWISKDHEGHVRSFICPSCGDEIPEQPGLVPFTGERKAAEVRFAHEVRSSVLRYPTAVGVEKYREVLHELFRRQRQARAIAHIAQDQDQLAAWLDTAIKTADGEAVHDSAPTAEDLSMDFAL